MKKNYMIKSTLLLVFTLFGLMNANAQTTHNLNWFAGMGSNVDLTIESGDTVIWTWTSPNHTVENTPGNSVETFNSGFLGPVGSTFSYTFTVIGDNDYFCGIHGAASMSGTITVTENLGIGESSFKLFTIVSNPATDILLIDLPQITANGQLTIHDMLGKNITTQTFNDTQTLNLNISALNQGLHFISIESDSKKQTQRFVKN